MKSTTASIVEVVALLARLDKRGKTACLLYLEAEIAKAEMEEERKKLAKPVAERRTTDAFSTALNMMAGVEVVDCREMKMSGTTEGGE